MVVLLAYKRYIHKKGKRHGPYYYKNVRDESGKVKSIYLGKVGARGKKPLEVAIVFLVALVIIISALFFIQNRNLVLSRITVEESFVPFEIDQILIKVLVKEKEFIEKELRVMNIGNEEVDIDVKVLGISDIINVLDESFAIKPGQTKIVRLNFSSFDSTRGMEQAPGVYIGKIVAKTGSYERELPVVIEIESKNVLFDMNLNPVARDRKVLQGSSTTFEVRVFNLKSIESSNVDMDFFVKDINGNTIISERESVVVKTQASFFKTLKIPDNLKTGDYIFVAQASLGNSVGTSSYLFEVEEIEKEKKAAKFIGFCRNDPLCWALSIIVLLLIFMIGAYAYFFIGAFIYKKLFGVRVPKPTKEEIPAEKPIVVEEKKESSVTKFFRNWRARRNRARELRIKRKFELQRQKLKLKEEKESLKLRLEEGRRKSKEEKKERKHEEWRKKVFEFFHGLGLVKTQREKREIEREYENKRRLKELEEKNREEERKKRELEEGRLREKRLRQKEKELEIDEILREKEEKKKEERKGLVGKCRKLIEKGYRALDKNNWGKADKIYAKLMAEYIDLPSERKVEIFKEIDSFYKSLLLKKQQLRQIEEREKKRLLEEEKQKGLEEKKKEQEKIRRIKLIEEKRKARRKKVFDFYHGLGLVKSQKEKREREMQKQREKKRIELERKKDERRKQRESELKEEERVRNEEEKKKKDLEKKKQKELERERKKAEIIKKQQDKNRRLKEIEELEDSIIEKDGRINKLKEKIRETNSDKNSIAKEISNIERDVEGLKNEKKMLFKVYSEGLKGKNQIVEEHKNSLAEWKNRYDTKVKEKNLVKKEVKEEYENELKELEDELQGLSYKERKDQEKWKKLQIKAKYKLEEKEREKVVIEELKSLQKEKKELEREFNKKKQSLGKGAFGKEVLQKQKDLDDHIREHEKGIKELNKKIQSKERSLEKYEDTIEKLEEEKEKAKKQLREDKRDLPGLSLIASFFRFKRKEREDARKSRHEQTSSGSQIFGTNYVGKAKAGRKEIEREGERKEEAKEEVKKDDEGDELQKSLKELGEVFEQKKKEKGFLRKIIKSEKKKIPEEKEIEIKRKNKSRLFIKCHKLLLIADKALQNNNTQKAKRLYLKSRNLYTKLEYLEKKELYDELNKLYNKFSKLR